MRWNKAMLSLMSAQSAQKGSHNAMKLKTRIQDMATLNAATFILLTTISPEDKGRTAKNEGTERVMDQNSGLINALPTAKARTKGTARILSNVSPVNAGSRR